MNKFVLVCSLCLLMCGCPSVDEITLTTQEAEELVSNVETAIVVQQEMTKLTLALARGETDIAGYTYDPPTAENGWVGTLTADSATFPFGTGDFTMTFTVIGDSGPVDPYTTDITNDNQVTVTVDSDFLGVHKNMPIDIGANFGAVTSPGGQDLVTANINGDFEVDYEQYATDFVATNLDVTVDTAEGEITSIVGELEGDIEIPGFKFDGELDIEGLGDALDLELEVADTALDYVLMLEDLFGGGV